MAGTLCLLVHGCDAVNGGAVELSWKLRPASSSLADKFVDCDSKQTWTNPVTGIRLHWREDGQDGSNDRSQVWRCEFNNGVTRFDLPEGTNDLWVTPECEGGRPAAPETYIAPATVQRRVIRGDTVSLGAIELVVAVSNCRNPTGSDTDNIGLQACICCMPGETCTPPPPR